MYPEVEEYFRTANQRERDYQKAITTADRVYQDATQELRWKAEDENRSYDRYGADADEFRRLTRERDQAYELARQAQNGEGSARALLTGSAHKEVAWIANNILFNGRGSEEENYAKTILRALPADQETLWRIAKDENGMCEVFDRYFDQAQAAGVFGNQDMVAAREMAALRSYVRRNWGGSYMSDLQRRLDPVLKAVKADYERKLTEAKAEWQRQDEARAENIHRNRSEGARRAAETRRLNQLAAQDAADSPPLRVLSEEEATETQVGRLAAFQREGVPEHTVNEEEAPTKADPFDDTEDESVVLHYVDGAISSVGSTEVRVIV